MPPPRFCTKELKPKDVNFCYGSSDGYLWKVLDEIFGLQLLYDNSLEAVKMRKEFLKSQNIGICDIVERCKREEINALDSGMKEVVLRNIVEKVKEHKTIHTLIFTGGGGVKSPEYFFKKQLQVNNLKFTCKDEKIPKKHEFILNGRVIQTISLTSPSGSANRSIGANPAYKAKKAQNPRYSTFDFRVEQYGKVFKPV